jgi:hypothetical protein
MYKILMVTILSRSEVALLTEIGKHANLYIINASKMKTSYDR